MFTLSGKASTHFVSSDLRNPGVILCASTSRMSIAEKRHTPIRTADEPLVVNTRGRAFRVVGAFVIFFLERGKR